MLSFLISLSKSKRCVVNCCILKDICVRKSKYEIVFLDINKTFLYISAYLRNIFVYLQHKIQT